ncbi:2-oxoacid:acceptor oxidoreductase family protein [Thermosediminibacter litoriperuensis]
MEERVEIRLSGSGGQGLILAGIILAEAAILDGKNAVQSQSYGPEARGGASRAEVVISNDEIDYPKVTKPQVILALTNEALNKFKDNLAPDGIIIIDSSVKKADTPYKIVQLPIIETARDRIGRSMVANIVAVGVITALTKVVSREAVERAILKRVPKGTEELNKKALYAGYELVNQLT